MTTKHSGTLFEGREIKEGAAVPGIPSWGAGVYRGFLDVILDTKFPCTFAALGFSQGLYRFAFLPDPRAPHCAKALAAAMAEYLGWLKTLPPENETFAVLVVFCAPIGDIGEDGYRGTFENLLRGVNLHDSAPWPAHVPKRSDDARFTFCFGGREIFVNANTPSHRRRRSRNLGPSFTLVIQPRDVFDKIGTPKIRESIRARIPGFDGMPVSPEIGVFGDDRNREFAGYFLSDDNNKAASRLAAAKGCPFSAASATTHRVVHGLAHHSGAVLKHLAQRISTFLQL